MLTKEDFLEWKKNPITQAVFDSIQLKINEGAIELSYMAGENQLQDRFKAGMIQAYRDVIDIQIEEVEPDA